MLEVALSSEHMKFQIPDLVYIIICIYALPVWIFTNIVRIKKIEFRLKIQSARLNNSVNYNNNQNDKLHINIIQFQFYEKWSGLAIIGLIAIITTCFLILYIFKKDIIFNIQDIEHINRICHLGILITIFLCMIYTLYKKYKLRIYKETIGIQHEINNIIIISLLCTFGYILFKFFVSIKFNGIPVSVWFVLFFILYHTIIIVIPVFTVHIYQNKVELLHEKYKRYSVDKIKIPNEINEMEINTFEKVLNPKCEIYKEFKKFLVGEVCIENLLFYEAMINILLQCQNKIKSDDNSWNLKQLAENPEGSRHSSFTLNNNDIQATSEIDETPYYEKLYETAIVEETTEIRMQLFNIFEKFIPEGSEYQLNLTSDLVKSVEQKITSDKHINILLFKPVLKEVYELNNTTSTLNVYLMVNVQDIDKSNSTSLMNKKVSSISIPLTEKTVAIEIGNNTIDKRNWKIRLGAK